MFVLPDTFDADESSESKEEEKASESEAEEEADGDDLEGEKKKVGTLYLGVSFCNQLACSS